ncbi:hypothetical protein V2J09_016488 [Rumex salicifolius]
MLKDKCPIARRLPLFHTSSMGRDHIQLKLDDDYSHDSTFMHYFKDVIRRIKCMAHKCNSVCDDAKVKTLVDRMDPQLADKFDSFILESYIEDNKRVKWCPSVPRCGNAIRVDDDEFCEVECSCGMQFCFSCSFEAHSPC